MSTPLIIKLDFEEDKIEDGVYAISIVDSPAIEVDFFTFNKYEFATYSDYPKAVSAAAERGIRLNEAVNNKCATQVGKVRAQQLAQGKPVSEETIKRMFAYLSRAKEYYNPDDTEACGTISYLLWGGEPALGWSERKLAQIERERELKAENELVDSFEFSKKKKTIYLISCSSDKLEKKAPASELYCSPLFRKSLEYARKQVSDDQIFILSAKYGLVPLNKVIEPYDVTLKDMPSDERKMWADEVYSKLEEQFNVSTDEFVFLAGTAYTEYLIPKFKYTHDFLEGKKIGERLEYLNKFYICFNSDYLAFSYLFNALEQLPESEKDNVIELLDKISQNTNKEIFCDADGGCEVKMEIQTDFTAEPEKQMIVSPVMIPNKTILRKSVTGEEFYVYFTPDTIEKMAHNFLKKKATDNFNIQHDTGTKLKGISVVESWVKQDDNDKSSKYGFNLPDGTWFVMLKVEDTNLWNLIKTGAVKGLSLEGYFGKQETLNKFEDCGCE